jgi:hypothetical protein
MQNGHENETWLLVTLVVGHVIATFLHGGTHMAADVRTTPLQSAFILTVIEIGPIAGLVLALSGRAVVGGWLIAATMLGALIFGVVNHFVIPGPDRVDFVVQEWRLPFAGSAVVLAIIEAAGAAAGFRYAMRRMEQSS